MLRMRGLGLKQKQMLESMKDAKNEEEKDRFLSKAREANSEYKSIQSRLEEEEQSIAGEAASRTTTVQDEYEGTGIDSQTSSPVRVVGADVEGSDDMSLLRKRFIELFKEKKDRRRRVVMPGQGGGKKKRTKKKKRKRKKRTRRRR